MNIETLLRFRLIKNSKNPTYERSEKNKYLWRAGKFENNSGVLTGEVNNITVVDLDFYKCTGTNKFIETFNNYIDCWNTYTVKTGGGGFHLYFEYDKEVGQTRNDEYHIDIRNDGGYVVSPGSIVDGKPYTVYKNTTIKPMPIDIKTWLLDNLYTIEQKKKNAKKDVIIKDDKIYTFNHKYNLSYSELENIINNLPDKYWFEQDNNFLQFTSFCKYFLVQDLWDNINKTKPRYNYNNNISCFWNTCRPTEDIIDNILSEEFINYSKYKPCINNIYEPDKTIKKSKLGYDYFKNKFNYVVKSDTGTGKTTAFKHYVKENKLKFISVVSRISLADEQYNIFSEHGLDCKNYRISTDFNNNDNIIITIDSIRKLYDIDFKDYVIFLDEYNSLLEYLITATTLSKNRSLIYNKFIKIIKTSKQVIATDADINDMSLQFLRTYKQNIKYIKNTYQHNKNILAYELNNFNHLIKKLKSEEQFIVCTDSKTNAELINKLLNDPSICLIVGGDDKYYKFDEHKKIIFSPKIMYGIDSSMKRNVYCYYKEETIQPTGYLQQIARCRNIDILYYLFDKKKFTFNGKSFDDIVNETYNQNVLGIRYFKDEVKSDVYMVYQDILNKYTYNNYCYSSNKFAHFRQLLIDRGFKIEFNNKFLKVQDKQLKELKQELKQDKINNFDVKLYPIIHKILQVPDEHINDYKDFYIDPFLLTKHFNLMNMINKDIDELKLIMSNNHDYTVNKITIDKTKIIYLKKLKTYISTDTDFKNITINKELNDTDREILFEEYNIIFRNRSNKKTFDNDNNLLEYVSKIYKVLFGDNIIISKTGKLAKDKKGKRKDIVKYFINDDVLNRHTTLYNFRHTKQELNRLF